MARDSSDPERMASRLRGIEGALKVWGQVKRGAIVSEALRRNGGAMAPGERTLAASLLYSLVRRQSLWQLFMERFLLPQPSRFSWQVRDAVMVGCAGLMELRTFAPAALIGGLVNWTKARDPRGGRVVNAVLRKVLEQGPALMADLVADPSLEALCLCHGVPLWVGRHWLDQYGETSGRRLVILQRGSASLSLRISPGVDGEALAERFRNQGLDAELSPLAGSLRLAGSALPTALPGHGQGLVTAQSESSMAVGRCFAQLCRGYLLDMCAGRGVKTGQIAQLRQDSFLEAWDLSEGRVAAGVREMERLGLSRRTLFRQGDALALEPQQRPQGILLDLPCSGSGTWRRHPEGKWRLTPQRLDQLAHLQEALLRRALDLVAPGGVVLYCTCSLLRQENENVVKSVMETLPDLEELELPLPQGAVTQGDGIGRLLWPEDPWTDGFYLAALRRRGR